MKSSMSLEVKLITLLGVLILITIGLFISAINQRLALLTLALSIGLGLLFILLLMRSLRKIEIGQQHLVLKYRFGQYIINIEEVTQLSRLNFSHLTMSWGSKGIFGFNGSSMGGEQVSVNNRSKMIKIYCRQKTFIVSVDNPDQFIVLLNTKLKNNRKNL